MTNCLFDIDDLSFFNRSVYGFRHIRSDQIQREVTSGSGRGDAVSLANYGQASSITYDDFFCPDFELTESTCTHFQIKVEEFVESSLKRHHASARYRDAGFLILKYNMALTPYDFPRYPLGKYGSHGFKPEQVKASIDTSQFRNEDRNHAVLNTMLAMRDALHQQKLSAITSLLETHPDEHELLSAVKALYENKTAINAPLFALITCYFHSGKEALKREVRERIQQAIAKADQTQETKGNTCLKVIYHEFEPALASPEALVKQSYHAIESWNLDSLKSCLVLLPKTAFDNQLRNPISFATATRGPTSHDIIEALLDFNVDLYHQARQANTTPIYYAAYKLDLPLLKRFEQLHPIEKNDLSGPSGLNHILQMPASIGSEEACDVVEHLVKLPIMTIEGSKDDNPLQWCYAKPCCNDYEKRIRELLMTKANLAIKFEALMTSAIELYYGYEDTENFVRTNHKPFDEGIHRGLAILFKSLCDADCVRLRALFDARLEKPEYKHALLADLFQYGLDVIVGEDETAAIKVMTVFGNLCPREQREQLQQLASEKGKTAFADALNTPSIQSAFFSPESDVAPSNSGTSLLLS